MKTQGLRLLGMCVLAGIMAVAYAPVRADEPTGAKKESAKKSEADCGNWFTNFWVHRVGGTIGNGLKSGAGKMGRAFNSIGGDGDKAQDNDRKRAPEKAEKEKKEADKKAAEAKDEADEKAKNEAEKARKEKEKAEKQK